MKYSIYDFVNRVTLHFDNLADAEEMVLELTQDYAWVQFNKWGSINQLKTVRHYWKGKKSTCSADTFEMFIFKDYAIAHVFKIKEENEND